MKKILIVSISGIRDLLIPIKKLLEKKSYIVDDYPLFDKTIELSRDYKDDFIEYIRDSSPDILLWYFIDIPIITLKYILDITRIYSVLLCRNIIRNDISDKLKYFDLILTPSTSQYKEIIYTPGYDPDINFSFDSNISKNFECDISICINDLYENTYPVRKEILDKISLIPDISFHIYGPEYLYLRYPKNYKGYVEYIDLNTIYNSSKINLNISTHPDIPNERTSMILGSGGLLLTNTNGGVCISENIENIELQIKDILKNRDNYSNQNVSPVKWDKLVNDFHNHICIHFFDEVYYRNLYPIPDNISNMYEYWNEFGIEKNHIPYKFNVPKNFDYIQYYLDNIELSKSKDYLFWHFKTFSNRIADSNSEKYMFKFDIKKDFNIKNILSDSKIDSHGWFLINECFREIMIQKNVDDNLLTIGRLAKDYPNVNIEKLLELYFILL